MTRSFQLNTKLVSIHHPATSALLRRLGDKSLYNASTRSISSCTFPNSSRRQGSVRSSIPKTSNTSILPSLKSIPSGARPFTSQYSKKQLVSRPPQFATSTFSNSNQPHIVNKASLNSWAIVLLVGIISGAILYTVSPTENQRFNPPAQPEPETTEEPDEFFSFSLEIPNKMTGEALPGRPGTLTPHEEEKLREFWIATLQVFGALEKEPPTTSNGHTEAPARVDTGDKDKPKKKRFGLLRSKKNRDDTPASSADSTHSAAPTSTSTDDDKYGQTKEFHDALANLSPETLRATFWSMVKHDHPDALLLRFLRARKWDVERALVMMVSTMRWRASEMKVDSDIMLRGELGAVEDVESAETDAAGKKLAGDFLTQLRLGKSYLHGLDKDGRPMCFVRVRLHKQGEQSEESLERYTVFVIESARMVLAPPVDTACVVFDMTGFSMANMDYAPVKFMIKCFEANYPESLGVVLVHKAPWIFQGIWKIIRTWLDPVVASKVHFTNNPTELSSFIPSTQIPSELAGPEDWSYNYIEPVPGENDAMKDTATRDRLLSERQKVVREYEDATLEWVQGAGEEGGKEKEIKEKREVLAQGLRKGYWELDPYVRARSYYDRAGLINPGGVLRFYPGEEKAATALVGGDGTAASDVD